MVRVAQPWSVFYFRQGEGVARCEPNNPRVRPMSGVSDGCALSIGRPSTPGPGSPVATTRNADAVNKHGLSVAKHDLIQQQIAKSALINGCLQ
jgi:hypothetical protein